MAFIRELSRDVVIHDESRAYKGYTLFAPMYEKIAWLVDMNGRVVNFWKMDNEPGVNCRLLPNGNLMWLGRGKNAIKELGGGATELVEVDWDGNEVWRYENPMLHHDFVPMDNGNVMTMLFEQVPDDFQKRISGGIPGTELNGVSMGVKVIELTRDKEIAWEWNNFDHFDAAKDRECELSNRLAWGYTNSVGVMSNGDVLLSMRHLNMIIRIDKETGNVVWKWGPEQLLGHPHCVTALDNGNILVFDNGLHRKPCKPEHPHEISSFEVSRAVEVNPNTDEIVWEYIDPMHQLYTNFCGSAQRLPNDNTLICESRTGTFYEVTHEKELVWKYVSPFVISRPDIWGWKKSKLIFQAHRYGEDFEGFNNKDIDPERFEWVIQKKSQDTLSEEEAIQKRLSQCGY